MASEPGFLSLTVIVFKLPPRHSMYLSLTPSSRSCRHVIAHGAPATFLYPSSVHRHPGCSHSLAGRVVRMLVCKLSRGQRFSILWGICRPGGRVAESRGGSFRGSCQTALHRVIPLYVLTWPPATGAVFSTPSPTLVPFRAFLLSTPILLSTYLV